MVLSSIANQLRRLRTEIARLTCELSIRRHAELTGKIDRAARAAGLDHMGVAARRRDRRWIDESVRQVFLLL